MTLSRKKPMKRGTAQLARTPMSRKPVVKAPRGREARAKQDRRLAREAARRERALGMRKMYEAGRSTTEIGETFGLHHSNVSRMLRSVGVVMRPRVTNRGQAQRKAAQETTLRRAKQIVAARAGLRCEGCSKSLSWEPSQDHHRRPRRMGGSGDSAIHSPANLLHLCLPCHEWAEMNREDALRHGWLIGGPIADPDAVPIKTSKGWVLFDNEGGTVRVLPPPSGDARELRAA